MTQHPVAELRENPSLASSGKGNLAPSTFQILHSKSLGGRFAQQSNFISDLEEIVPNFYSAIGYALKAWQKPAPKIRRGRDEAQGVSTNAISDEAESYEPS